MGKIHWVFEDFKYLETVYARAAENKLACSILERFEMDALSEIEANCHRLAGNGTCLTMERFCGMNPFAKERIISTLADAGIQDIQSDMGSGTFRIMLSPFVQSMKNCTFFSILNRVENMYGVYQMTGTKMQFELVAPVGGQDGIATLNMLMGVLYPDVKKIFGTGNYLAEELEEVEEQVASSPSPAKKRGFFNKLFGR